MGVKSVVGKLVVPSGNSLRADILAVDEESYFILYFNDRNTQMLYKRMQYKMKICASGGHCIPERFSKHPGTDCIVEYNGRRGGSYARGHILYEIPVINRLKVSIYDEVEEVDVHRSQLFFPSSAILRFPRFSMKCKLAGMDMFEGHGPWLGNIFHEFMKLHPNSIQCFVEFIDSESRVPTVRLTTLLGKDLTDLLQQYIPTTLRLEYPGLGVPAKANITCCTDLGHTWFQLEDGKSVLDVVKSRLSLYNSGSLEKYVADWSIEASWRDVFCQGSGEIFIYKNVADQECYRVRVLGNSTDKGTTYMVFYVDYGKVETVLEDQLIPAKEVDPNLCFIPPQCLPVRFVGAECRKDNDMKIGFDLERFWKNVGGQACSIVLQETNPCEAFSWDKVTLANFVDPHMNFMPPECVAVGVVNQRRYSFDAFWAGAKNQPVSAVLKKYGIRPGKGKFDEGIMAPKADILVAQPSTDNFRRECDTSDPKSLLMIYHGEENCSVREPDHQVNLLTCDSPQSSIGDNSGVSFGSGLASLEYWVRHAKKEFFLSGASNDDVEHFSRKNLSTGR